MKYGRLLQYFSHIPLLVHLMMYTPVPHLHNFKFKTGITLTRRFQREAWTNWGGWNQLVCKAGWALAPGASTCSRGVWYWHFIDFWRVAHDFLVSRDSRARLCWIFILFAYQRHGDKVLALSKKFDFLDMAPKLFRLDWYWPAGLLHPEIQRARAAQTNWTLTLICLMNLINLSCCRWNCEE